MPAIYFNKNITRLSGKNSTYNSIYFWKDLCGVHFICSSDTPSGLMRGNLIDYRSGASGNSVTVTRITRNLGGYIQSIVGNGVNKTYAYAFRGSGPITPDSIADIYAVTEVYSSVGVTAMVSKNIHLNSDGFCTMIEVL